MVAESMSASASSKRLVAYGLMALLLLVGRAVSALAQGSRGAGEVSALQGQVTLERGGSSVPVVHGMAVQANDRFSTGPASHLTLTLSDGSQLELGAASALTLDEASLDPSGARGSTRLGLVSGLIRSLVKVAPGNTPNYEVHTPNAIAAARGTDYDVAYTNNQTREGHKDCREFTDVAVREGVVEVSNSANPAASVKLKKGQKTTVACGASPDPAAVGWIAPAAALGALVAGGAAVAAMGATNAFGGNEGPATASH
jgi:ferric-dicitrate binding protein FerR (iron transport regulator)